ncbi:MAG: DUF3899 domain-containing protein [Corallococcus sp.]|nr:DUF3899 domain-containing protein [Corallococcus sp.]
MKKYIKYVIAFVVCAVVTVCLLWAFGTFTQTDGGEIMKNLCDAFFVPGIIMLCIGLLVFATKGGAFDMLAYGVRKLFDLFKRDLTKVKYKTFYDYRKAQQEKTRDFLYMLIVGAVWVVISALFLVLYYNALPAA